MTVIVMVIEIIEVMVIEVVVAQEGTNTCHGILGGRMSDWAKSCMLVQISNRREAVICSVTIKRRLRLAYLSELLPQICNGLRECTHEAIAARAEQSCSIRCDFQPQWRGCWRLT
jgi:hypothetical protein